MPPVPPKCRYPEIGISMAFFLFSVVPFLAAVLSPYLAFPFPPVSFIFRAEWWQAFLLLFDY